MDQRGEEQLQKKRSTDDHVSTLATHAQRRADSWRRGHTAGTRAPYRRTRVFFSHQKKADSFMDPFGPQQLTIVNKMSTKMSATTEADVEAHVAAVEQLQRDAFALQAALERSRHVIVSTLMRSRLYDIMEGRVLIPRGSLASEMEDPRLKFPASLTSSGRLLLGDLGTVGSLLEGDGTEDIDRYLQQHPVRAVLVCMGADAARAVSKQFKKRGLDYLGLEGCVDEEGYPLLERHLEASNAFIREKLLAAAPDGCVLVHCHEGKNRSCALCVAFLMVQHRMRLTEAIQHVWSKRPMVLSNESFLQQLIDLAAREGLLS
jgi:hypothetical protein